MTQGAKGGQILGHEPSGFPKRRQKLVSVLLKCLVRAPPTGKTYSVHHTPGQDSHFLTQSCIINKSHIPYLWNGKDFSLWLLKIHVTASIYLTTDMYIEVLITICKELKTCLAELLSIHSFNLHNHYMREDCHHLDFMGEETKIPV